MRDGGSRLETGWTALRRGDWVTARDLFEERLGEEPEDPEALDGLGRALWWLGESAVSIERRREAYVIHRQQGNVCAAANIATYLAAEGRIAGEMAAANGWLARAERLLEDKDQCPERGWLEIEKAKRSSQEPREHERHARNAVKIGQTLNDHDLEAAGLSQLGLAKVDAGQVEEGLALLDESMTIATAEASDPLAIGDTCCTTLVASDRLADLDRATEWCRTVVEFTDRRGYTPLHLWCRTVYAGVLIRTGDWTRADEELTWALRGYQQRGGGGIVFALVRLAELRLLQGRVADAEAMLSGFEDHPLAITARVELALARQDHALADALVCRRLELAGEDRSARAILLPLCAEVARARQDHDKQRDLAEQVRQLGDELQRADLKALADLMLGRVQYTTGDPANAAAHLEAALAAFQDLEMPLYEARARRELAQLESGELGLFHARTALRIFERLGAGPDADATAAVLRGLGVAGRTAPRIDGPLTAREQEVLALLAEGLANAAIAGRLFISSKTAEHHVGRILGKLGLRSRAEAAAYVLRNQG